eukprot:UN30448
MGRLSKPRPGWVSLLTSDGKYPILAPVTSIVKTKTWHKVLTNTSVYKQLGSRSRRVGALKKGEKVFVTERIGSSNKIDKPIKGWIRSITNDGYAILEHIDETGRTEFSNQPLDLFWGFLDGKAATAKTGKNGKKKTIVKSSVKVVVDEADYPEQDSFSRKWNGSQDYSEEIPRRKSSFNTDDKIYNTGPPLLRKDDLKMEEKRKSMHTHSPSMSRSKVRQRMDMRDYRLSASVDNKKRVSASDVAKFSKHMSKKQERQKIILYLFLYRKNRPQNQRTSLSLDRYICKEKDLRKYALQILEKELPLKLRLMGVRLSNFQSTSPSNKLQQTIGDFFASPKKKKIKSKDTKEPTSY